MRVPIFIDTAPMSQPESNPLEATMRWIAQHELNDRDYGASGQTFSYVIKLDGTMSVVLHDADVGDLLLDEVVLPEPKDHFSTAVALGDQYNKTDWYYIWDWCGNWESAQNYALSEGRRIVALKGDGHMSKDGIQALCDAERARYNDCYGIE